MLKSLSQKLITLYYNNRHISSYLSSIKEIFFKAWKKMDRENKNIFMLEYNSSWMRNRHAMPYPNAIKMLKYIENGRLKIFNNVNNVYKSDYGKFDIITSGIKHHGFDLMLNCTSTSYELNSLDELQYNLMTKNIILANEFGGLNWFAY